MVIIERFKHVKRYRQIIKVFAKHGFGSLLDRMGIYDYLNIEKRRFWFKLEKSKAGKEKQTIGERLRRALEELGPTFIKIGQILSTRSDIFPPQITQELQKLQESAEPIAFLDVKQIIENEFGNRLEKVFHAFEEQPLAAASIAQVHLAMLDSGERVVVKIQRQGIERSIYFDLKILEDLAYFIDVHTKYGRMYDFRKLVQNFEQVFQNELDFRIEAENAERFKKNFMKDKGVKVPEIFWTHTSRRVLTMEYIEGFRLNEMEQVEHLGWDKKWLAKNLADSMVNQILRDGFFHADPHPGNIKILNNSQLVFLDLGMVGHLTEQRRRQFIKILAGIAFKNSKFILQALMDLGTMVQRKDMKQLELEIDFIREKYLSLPLNKIKVSEIFTELFDLAFAYKFVMPPEFAMITKALITAESIVGQLNPEMNLLEASKPIAKRMMLENYSSDKVGKILLDAAYDYGHLFRDLPGILLGILKKIENDEFAVQIKLKDIDNTQRSIDKIFNRLSFSVMILAVSIITAGIIVSTGLGNFGGQLDVTNQNLLHLSLIIAGVMIIGLFFAILRTGRF